MLFENVSIAGLAHVDAPHTLTSLEINERLKPTFERLRIRADMLGDIAGVHARRLWDPGTQASDAAGVAALEPGDALLIAGKGHETGQIVGDKTLPFSDHDAVAAALASRVA